jgi:SAM-dependent methyltransferase
MGPAYRAHVDVFGAVVDEYDAGRPGYPAALFDALEPLAGKLVLEGGAGTGLATVGLMQHRARVIAFDVSPAMLARATRREASISGVVADGAATPFRDACADLLCFAQSWHWLDPDRRVGEAARILRPGGRWAAWWSHARADGEPWFESYFETIEAATVARRAERDTDWGSELGASNAFDAAVRQTFRWIRETSVDQWLADDKSKSYISSLPAADRRELLEGIRRSLEDSFPDGQMRVPYETWLWTTVRR